MYTHTCTLINAFLYSWICVAIYYSMTDGLMLPHSHKWFSAMVKNWIRIASDKCRHYTSKAITADSAITVTDEVMFSTSAVDTIGFLLQFGSFWQHLEWPDASVAYGYAVSVVQKISECALYYVGEVFKKLSHKDMFDEKGRFRASEKVSCFIVVTSFHLSLSLSLSLFLSLSFSLAPLPPTLPDLYGIPSFLISPSPFPSPALSHTCTYTLIILRCC